MNKEELNCYHKIWSIINKTDLLNFDERDELHLFLMKFKDENKHLQTNWNELKKWLEEYYDYGDCLKIKFILNKMAELERGEE